MSLVFGTKIFQLFAGAVKNAAPFPRWQSLVDEWNIPYLGTSSSRQLLPIQKVFIIFHQWPSQELNLEVPNISYMIYCIHIYIYRAVVRSPEPEIPTFNQSTCFVTEAGEETAFRRPGLHQNSVPTAGCARGKGAWRMCGRAQGRDCIIGGGSTPNHPKLDHIVLEDLENIRGIAWTLYPENC